LAKQRSQTRVRSKTGKDSVLEATRVRSKTGKDSVLEATLEILLGYSVLKEYDLTQPSMVI